MVVDNHLNDLAGFDNERVRIIPIYNGVISKFSDS